MAITLFKKKIIIKINISIEPMTVGDTTAGNMQIK